MAGFWRTHRLAIAALGAVAVLAIAIVGPIVSDPGGPEGGAHRAERQVREYLAEREGTYGVAIRDLRDHSAGSVRADEPFRTASMYKLLVMYAVVKRIHAGDLAQEAPLTITAADTREGDPEDGLRLGERVTVRQALEKMITVSSNAAAYALARQLGGWEVVRAVPGELGLRNTRFDDFWWSTPNDLAHFFQQLAEGRLVNERASAEMIELLKRQTRDDRIPARLPAEVQVAHKTGELDGIRNDGGIVYGDNLEYVLVLMSEETEPGVALRTQAEVSRLVYDTLVAAGAEVARAQAR